MMYQGPIRFAAIDEHRQRATTPHDATTWCIVTADTGPDGKRRYAEIPIGHGRPRGAFAYEMENALYTLQYLLDHPEIDGT